MSWYSKIYVFVREYRQLHPFIGFFLHHFLNIMLVIQVICLAYGYYVFMFVTCKYWIGPNVRAVAYMCFYHSLLLLALWSLGMTIGTPIMRVPPKYHADPDTDKRLKSVTPLSGKRYKPDDSDDNQVAEQTRILNDFAASRGLLFAEEDHLGRLRYCYQCNLIKPDRSHHCSSCGFCVVKFDHHCPWINKCVNHANYKYFMLFITYGTLFICISVALQIEVIVRFFMSDMEKTWPMVMPVVFNLMLYGVFSYFPLGELLIYHLKLIAVNETTCEQAKVPLIKGDRLANYNFGWYENYRSVFGWGFWPFPVNTSISDGLHFPINYSDISVGPRYEVVPVSSVKKASLKHSKRSSKRSKRSKHSKATEIPGKSGDATPAKKSHSRSKSSSKDTCSTQTSGSLPLRSATTQQSVDV